MGTTTESAVGRVTHGRDFVMQVFGGLWFLLLGVLVATRTVSNLGSVSWIESLTTACQSTFYFVLWYLIVTRPPARACAKGVLPCVAAFVGTYMPWSIALLRHHVPWPIDVAPTVTNIIALICLSSGTILAIITVSFLGRSFSIIPRATAVVQTGPYRWIRHPLYAAEQLAMIGTVMQALSPIALAIFFAHVAFQVTRIHYEEQLLLRTLPAYRDYSAARWRVVPFVW